MKDFVRIETLQQTLSPPLSMRKIPVHMPMSNQFPYIVAKKCKPITDVPRLWIKIYYLYFVRSIYRRKFKMTERTTHPSLVLADRHDTVIRIGWVVYIALVDNPYHPLFFFRNNNNYVATTPMTGIEVSPISTEERINKQ